MKISKKIFARFKNIKHFIVDVDGVLTNGQVYVDGRKSETKAYHILDGTGLCLLRGAGIGVSLVSGRSSDSTLRRAKELKIKDVYQGIHKKGEVLDKIARANAIEPRQILFIGDDLIDIPALAKAGAAVAVANAVDEVKRVAHYVTTARGGEGAVREVIDLVLKSQGLWEKVLGKYLSDKI